MNGMPEFTEIRAPFYLGGKRKKVHKSDSVTSDLHHGTQVPTHVHEADPLI